MTVDDPVSVTYRIDEDCFMQARNLIWDHQAIGHRGNVKTGVGLAALGVFFWVYGHFAVLSYFLIGGGIVLACMSYARNVMWRRHYWTIEKYREAMTTTFSDADIEVVAHHETVTVQWPVFSAYFETPDALLLVVDSKQFSIIPTSAFAHAGDAERLLRLVSQKLSPVPKRSI